MTALRKHPITLAWFGRVNGSGAALASGGSAPMVSGASAPIPSGDAS